MSILMSQLRIYYVNNDDYFGKTGSTFVTFHRTLFPLLQMRRNHTCLVCDIWNQRCVALLITVILEFLT